MWKISHANISQIKNIACKKISLVKKNAKNVPYEIFSMSKISHVKIIWSEKSMRKFLTNFRIFVAMGYFSPGYFITISSALDCRSGRRMIAVSDWLTMFTNRWIYCQQLVPRVPGLQRRRDSTHMRVRNRHLHPGIPEKNVVDAREGLLWRILPARRQPVPQHFLVGFVTRHRFDCGEGDSRITVPGDT